MKDTVTQQIEKFNFHGDELAVATVNGDHYVVLTRLCAAFNLDVKTQADKLKSLDWAGWGIIPAHDASGRKQELFCLSLRSVAGWLFTINAGKVAEHLRPKLLVYQRECADVLADHFLGKRGMSDDRLLAGLAPIAKALEALAKAQLAQEERLAAMEARLRENGVLSYEKVNAIKARVRSCTSDLGRLHIEKRRAASLRIHARLKNRVGWSGAFCRLDNMPACHEALVLRELEIIEHETRGKVEAATQLTLPNLHLAVNNNRKKVSA